MFKIITLLVLASFSGLSMALTYSLPTGDSRLVGQNQQYTVLKGDTMASIAERYQVGFLALMAANKGVDPFLPEPDTDLLIPTQLILPDVKHEGIVVNLAELRLYYFRPEQQEVDIFPIGIGRIGRDTPEMTTKISGKRAQPTWTPTANIRTEYEAKGITLPQVVKAGPDNPLGEYALRLAYGGGEYLIHGTNKEFGVGLRVSSGCIRLFPSDIEYLFSQVQVGLPVRVIDQALKYTSGDNGEQWLEVHQPLTYIDKEEGDYQPRALNLNRNEIHFITQAGVDSSTVQKVIKAQQGVVLNILQH